MHVRLLFISGGILLSLWSSAPSAAMARSLGSTPSILELLPREQMDCGKRGWLFGSVIGGRLPLTACMLKFKSKSGRSPFGPM